MTPDEYIETALKDLSDVYGPATVLAHATVLFAPREPSSPSRTGDPSTSHDSGARRATRDVRRFSTSSLQGQLLHLFATNSTGYTALEAASEITDGQGLHAVESARKRVSELVRAGYLRDSTERRANRGSSDLSVVLTLTEEGSIAYSAMRRTGWTRDAA